MGHSLGNLRIIRGGRSNSPRPPSRKATQTTLILLFACVMLPEINVFFKDDAMAWRIYLTAGEVVKAGLCALLAFFLWGHYVLRIGSLATGVWYLTQAVDEATEGNTWYHGRWEYLVLAVYMILLYLVIRSHNADEH